MKFYRVTAEIEYVIACEDDEDEFSAADDAWRDVKYDEEPSIFVGNEIKSLKDLPSGWDGECIPYGAGDGNTRLKEMLNETVL